MLKISYNDREFPIDFDLNGNLYRINNHAYNMTGSIVICHLGILADKRAKIKIKWYKNATQ